MREGKKENLKKWIGKINVMLNILNPFSLLESRLKKITKNTR